MGAVASGVVQTSIDYKECLKIVRAGSPRWCGRHEEFESVACEVIGSALATYDPQRGSFSDRLIVRSQSRVARTIVRSMPPLSVTLEPIVLPTSEKSVGNEPEAVGLDAEPALVAEGEVAVEVFLDGLHADLQPVARLLYAGLNQAEVAADLGLGPRAVSRLVTRIKPLAATYFDRLDLLAA